MFLKTTKTVLLLGAAVLLQVCCCTQEAPRSFQSYPLAREYVETGSPFEGKYPKAFAEKRLKLLQFITNEFVTTLTNCIDGVRNVIEPTLRDAEEAGLAGHSDTDLIVQQMKVLMQPILDLDNDTDTNKGDKAFKLLGVVRGLLDHVIHDDRLKEQSPRVVAILALLRKYGVFKVPTLMPQELIAFGQVMESALAEYLHSLTPEERGYDREKFVDLLTKLKDARDPMGNFVEIGTLLSRLTQ